MPVCGGWVCLCSCVHSQNKCPAPCHLMTSSKANLASSPPFPYPTANEKPDSSSFYVRNIAGCATGSARFLSAQLHGGLLSLYILWFFHSCSPGNKAIEGEGWAHLPAELFFEDLRSPLGVR